MVKIESLDCEGLFAAADAQSGRQSMPVSSAVS